MTRPDPSRVMAVFAAVVRLDPADREAALERRCPDEPAVRAAVTAMLAADARPPDWLADDGLAERAAARAADIATSAAAGMHADAETHAPGDADADADADDLAAARTFDRLTGAAAGDAAGEAARRLPDRIGPFRIVRLLGAGGMGTVYEAQQDRPRRTVALKLVRAAGGSPAAARRFEIEIASLGRLSHPGIARLLEVGVHEDPSGSHPWIAVEYVPGVRPLDRHADEAGLDRRARLELLAEACDAVHHGHQRGVIHRDLKPDNVLVDEAGRVRVIDFGIARAAGLDEQLGPTLAAGATASGQWVGTPRYMSPEQCAGRVRSVDVRTDTWALGVLAYELLVGRPPHGSDPSVITVARRILEEPPTPPRRIVRDLEVDVEAVLLRALEKDPDRRYQTAADLAAELRRLVAGEPVAAMRHRRLYVLRRWLRRRRVPLAAATAALVLAAGAGWLVREAARERLRSDQASALRQLAGDQREIRDPFLPMDVDPARVNAFESALEAAAAAGRLDPVEEADLRTLLAELCVDLGEHARGRPQVERATTLRRGGAGGPVALAETLHAAGRVRFWTGDLDEAEEAYREAIDLRRRHVGPGSPELANSLNDLAATLTRGGRDDESIQLFEQALAIRERALGADSPWTIATLNNLGVGLKNRGRFQDAEPRLREAVAGIERIIRDTPAARPRLERFALRGRRTLADCLLVLGRAEEAREVLATAEARAAATLPPGHEERRRCRLAMAAWHVDAPAAAGADPAAALAILAADERGPNASNGPNGPDALDAPDGGGPPTADQVRRDLLLARALLALGRPEDAVAPLGRALAGVREVHDADHPTVGEVLLAEGERCLAAGEVRAAGTRLAESQAILTRRFPEGHLVRRRLDRLAVAVAASTALPASPGDG